jgi:hypothetical protein
MLRVSGDDLGAYSCCYIRGQHGLSEITMAALTNL